MSDRATKVGVAISDGLPELIASADEVLDYVEVPFERLAHAPNLLNELRVPVILHCASLSLAGNLPPHQAVVAQLSDAIARSGTPWLGEHLAFVSMSSDAGPSLGHPAFAPSVDAASMAPGDPGIYNIGYTVSPQYSPEIVERIASRLDHWESVFGCPVLVENGPVYFDIPGSTMSQAEFIRHLCRNRPSTNLLLDLAHLACTAANTGTDAYTLLDSLPLERVVEVHLSGYDMMQGRSWDDHAVPIPADVFALLDCLLQKVRPLAVTVEYNWDPNFPNDIVRRDLSRVREALAARLLAA